MTKKDRIAGVDLSYDALSAGSDFAGLMEEQSAKVSNPNANIRESAVSANAQSADGDTVVINEVLASHTGTDDTEYVELFGTPGMSLDGLSLIVVEASGSAAGDIDFRLDFGPGDEIGSNGFFLVGNPAGLGANYGVVPDVAIATNSFENSDSTFALVETASLPTGGTVGGGEIVLDSVALTAPPAGASEDGTFYFGAPGVGPDGSFFPAGARRVIDGADTDTAADWVIADFLLGTANTPTPGGAGSPPPDLNLVINEILADPPSDAAGDANGDGLRDASQDELVEIVNAGTETADLSGITISDAVGIRHVFADGTTLAAGARIVVFGGGTPTGDFGGAQVVTASTGLLGFNNGGDTVTLASGDGTVVYDEVTYGSEGGDDQSLTRSPEVTGDFVRHSTLPDAGPYSPGTEAEGSAPPPPTPTLRLIGEVQGDDDANSLAGERVTVQGIVTLVSPQLNGFFVQGAGDGDAATSDGIFVFTGSDPTVAVGDAVEVTGDVSEFFGSTQLSGVEIDIGPSGNALPDAVVVELPLTDATDPGAFYESLEGMRVSFVAPDGERLVVTDTFTRFGEVGVTTQDLLFQPTQVFDSFTPEAEALAEANARDFIKFENAIDDSLSSAPRAGDGIVGGSIDGVLAYTFGEYKVETDGAVAFDESVNPVPRTEAPQDVGGDLTVATFNVLNYFVTLGSRGAATEEELQDQTSKIVAALAAMDADVVGLIEIENDDGAATEALVDALNAEVGAGTYDYIHTGVIGTDAIKQAFIYKPAEVTPVGDFAVLDTEDFVAPFTPGDPQSRPALAQSWEEVATGEQFTAAVNHFKSKGSQTGATVEVAPGVFEADDNPVEGSAALTRVKASLELSEWLATNPTGIDDPDVMIMGDLNAYAMERAIRALKGESFFGETVTQDWTNVLAEFEDPLAASNFTYAFDGEFGTLDYVFANEPLLAQITGATAWHVNSLESYSIQYDGGDFDEFGSAESPYASSDHDPVLVGLDLQPAQRALVLGEPGPGPVFGSDAAEILDGQGGRVDLMRGFGKSDIFVFTDIEGERDKLIIADYMPGVDLIDLNGETIAAVSSKGANLWIELEGDDGDYLLVRKVGDIDEITFVDDPFAV